MNLVTFTIVLDGGEFIKKHLPIFQQLSIPWRWIVVEGSSQNTGSTSWCRPQPPRLSNDGTTEYLKSITDPRVTCLHSPDWKSKDDQCNAALAQITEPCVLMQIDADEIWQPSQVETIVRLFDERPPLSSIMFACRYFVGPNLILEGSENCYGNFDYEWLRAFRFTPGQRFLRHEPPVLEGDDPSRRMSKEESRKLGLVFDHFAYATEAQVAFKEEFYGYRWLVSQWHALQNSRTFPVTLSRYFGHVSGDKPKVIRI